MTVGKTCMNALAGAAYGLALTGPASLVCGAVIAAIGTPVGDAIRQNNTLSDNVSGALASCSIGALVTAGGTALIAGAAIGGLHANGFFQSKASRNILDDRKKIIPLSRFKVQRRNIGM